MIALLIEPDGKKHRVLDGDADEVLREHEAEGDIVRVNLKDDTTEFTAFMAIDPAQRVNTPARMAIVSLSGLHVMCFGPVLLAGLDDDTVTELVGG